MVMPRSVETCPSSGGSSPAIIRNSVVLPAPFGPTSPIFSPLLRAADASMNRIWWPACLLTLSRRIMRSFWGIVALQRHRPCRPPGEARPDPDQPRAPPNSRNSTRSLGLVDLHGLHHAHLLMVHHVAVEHVDAGEIDEARAEHDLAALALHDHGIPPFRHRQRLQGGRRIFSPSSVSLFDLKARFFVPTRLAQRRRAQALSRLAVALTLRHAPPLPGHTLTAPSATARLVRSG